MECAARWQEDATMAFEIDKETQTHRERRPFRS